MLHAYPSMDRVLEIRDAHECRLLWSALGPLGDVVCTGAGDENLKFWRLWEAPKKVKGKGKESGVEAGTKLTTRGGILSLR
jgi:cell division cycle protein 20 (cofactor of APC complex)